jgi:hypothetical protein
MSEPQVAPRKNVIYNLPDWFMAVAEPYAESITPVSLFNIAAGAFLQNDNDTWFDFVEPVAEQAFDTEPDGEVLVCLAIELLEEMFPLLDAYLKTIIPQEEKVIMDIESINDLTFCLTWDEGIIR